MLARSIQASNQEVTERSSLLRNPYKDANPGEEDLSLKTLSWKLSWGLGLQPSHFPGSPQLRGHAHICVVWPRLPQTATSLNETLTSRCHHSRLGFWNTLFPSSWRSAGLMLKVSFSKGNDACFAQYLM